MSRFINALIGLTIFLYPLAVYIGIQYFQPRLIAALLAALLLMRLAVIRSSWTRPLLIAGLTYAIFAAISNQPIALRFYPVVVNAAMLLVFGASLIYPPSLIERIARIGQPGLPPQAIAYTRRVTQVWCGFFVINGSIAMYTALWSSFETWCLYNGLIAYLLMVLLFAGEYWVRLRSQKPG